MKFCQLRKIARPPHDWRSPWLDKPNKRSRDRGGLEIGACRGTGTLFSISDGVKHGKYGKSW
jgi:hypothetical protein